MSDEWIIDGVLRPRGAKAYLRGGPFDHPCGSNRPVWIVDAADETNRDGVKVMVHVRNEGSCPFSVRLLDSAGKVLVDRAIDPGNDSGLIIRSGIATGQVICGGTAEHGRCKGNYWIWLGD